MTHQNENDLDINAIQELNLERLQNEIYSNSILVKAPEEKEEWVLSEKNEEETTDELATLEVEVEESKEEASVTEDPLLDDINRTMFQKIVWWMSFVLRYILTASFIFVVLMAFTNYSAYITIAKSYLNPDSIVQSEKNLNKSLEVSQISVSKKEKETPWVKDKKNKEEDIYKTKDLRNILWDVRKEEIELDIEIIPFVNRMIIPKIGKNIPLVDIAQWEVEGMHELNDIFMDELKWGVVRYPGSARPWEFWNAFVFWHSSNFPWVEWDYNDVFALLDKIEIWDEVVTYYEGKKYTYKIQEKKVINPNDVSVLKRDTWKKEITLMTCWPIGTTYNRLLVIGELVK